MGLAISGMHYTGMAAASFEPGSICRALGSAMLADASLGFSIGAVVILILAATLMASMFDARLASQTMQMLRNAEQAREALEREVEARREAQEQLARYAEELRRSNRELEQFAYVASHDLQAPLRAIAGFVDLLRLRLEGGLDEDGLEFMRHITEGVRNMRRLIDALLELARIGRKELNPVRVPLESVVQEAQERLRAVIDERGAVIEQGVLPEVEVDAVLMTQLVQNLLDNAIKFQPGARPQVRVSAQREPAGWVLAFSDRGIGIEQQHFERIFKIFQRLHGREQYSGDGIGLALCERIAELHGGRIWVESEAGKGATFYVFLPDPSRPRAVENGAGGMVGAVGFEPTTPAV